MFKWGDSYKNIINKEKSYIDLHFLEPSEKRNEEFIFLSYDVRDYFSQRPTSDRFEIVVREYFKRYFLESKFNLTLSKEEEIYILKTYWAEFFKGIFLNIKNFVNSIVDPIIKDYADLWIHIKNPIEVIPFNTYFSELFLDLLICYSHLDFSHYNLCIGASLVSYYKMVELDNGFFLRIANLFNDFAFFNEYHYDIFFQVQYDSELSTTIYETIVKEITPFDFTFLNIIKYISISIWEYYFPPQIVYTSFLYGIISLDTIEFLSEIINEDNISLQEFLTMSYIDRGNNHYYRPAVYLEDYEDLYTLYKYDKAMDEHIAKLYKLKVYIETFPYFIQSIYFYFTYKYIKFLVSDLRMNDIIIWLGLYEHLLILMPMQRSMKDESDPIHHSKPQILNFLIVKLSIKQAYDIIIMRNRIYFNSIKVIQKIISFLSLKLINFVRIFSYLDDIFMTFIIFWTYFYEKEFFYNFCKWVANKIIKNSVFLGKKFNLIKKNNKKEKYIIQEERIPVRFEKYEYIKRHIKKERNTIIISYSIQEKKDRPDRFYRLRKSNYIQEYSLEEKQLPKTPKLYDNKYFEYIIPKKILEKHKKTKEEYIAGINLNIAIKEKKDRERRAKLALAYGKYNEKEFGEHDEQLAYDDLHAFVMREKAKAKAQELFDKKMQEKGQREEREKIHKYLSIVKEFFTKFFKK